MSPWYSLAYAGRDMYVRLNSSEGQCVKLISVGGANYANLTNASRTCGPAGEWKRRIAENLSSMFFQGGFEWVKSENQTIEVVTEEGTFEVEVNEAKYEAMRACWTSACGCEQANNPYARGIFIALLIIAVGGISYDSIKVAWQKIVGTKPPKHVECKNGHRLEEEKFADRHLCDVCGARGTQYQCTATCNYDMCKKCYKAKKKDVKAEWDKWIEKHPEDKKKSKKGDNDDKDDDDADKKSDAEEKDMSGKETSEKETSEKDTTDKDTGDEKDSEKETEPESKDDKVDAGDNKEAEADGEAEVDDKVDAGDNK